MPKKSVTSTTTTRRRSGVLSVEERLNRAHDAIVMICAAALADVDQLNVGAIDEQELLSVIGKYGQDVAEELYWLKKLSPEVLNADAPCLDDEEGGAR